MAVLPDDGATVTPKHVGAVLMYILTLFLRQLTGASVDEYIKLRNILDILNLIRQAITKFQSQL